MPNIILKAEWNSLSEKDCTPEELYYSRRSFLKRAGLAALGTAYLACNPFASSKLQKKEQNKNPLLQYDPHFLKQSFPAKRDPRFSSVAKRKLTPELICSTYNNYYEFSQDKQLVWELASNFQTDPWSIAVGGLLQKKPRSFPLEKLLLRFSLEERIYRFRCVEAWSMVVPWIGIPLAKLLRFFEPSSKARYVQFIGWNRPEEALGQRYSSYSWPYYEALRLDEAYNELAMLVVGMYGHPLSRQNGAPVRLIIPWKYGYKSMKGITRIEFTAKRPPTFWNDAAPLEYGFYSNVNPKVPHPRWSQASERIVGKAGRIATLPYNGYGKWVAHMYKKKDI